jgi:hypothetical protein
MTDFDSLDRFRLELSVKAKNGVNFIVAAAVVWALIAWIWSLPLTAQGKSLLMFMSGAIMLPLAWLFSKAFRTQWSVPGNPLQPLGLWLNFAQLFYFPILFFVYARNPAQTVMVYVVITGAHLFPYAWYYQARAYAVMAGVISVGAMVLALAITEERQLYLLPVFMVASLVVLSLLIHRAYLRSRAVFERIGAARPG